MIMMMIKSAVVATLIASQPGEVKLIRRLAFEISLVV
jgi:hypothetical protein